jgi:sialate O-acetylesterase
LNPKGVIWYQGESNAHNVELHEQLFALLEKSWRNYFNEPNLPFYFVQLSSIAPRHSWPHFRDSQRQLAETLPYTWMAVSSDLGHPSDVHPRNKRPVGQRLAFQALRNSFGKNLVAEGPKCNGIQVKGSAILINFANAEGMKTADGAPLRGFEVAGADGIFHPATAEIKGTQIKVHAKAVKHPLSVRYAWQPFTDANLINGAGIPASTFRLLVNE